MKNQKTTKIYKKGKSVEKIVSTDETKLPKKQASNQEDKIDKSKSPGK